MSKENCLLHVGSLSLDVEHWTFLVVFVILSALWLRLKNPVEVGGLVVQAIPAGLFIALLLVLKIEKYQFNRKIWYVTIIFMAILTSFTPVGVMI